MEADDFEPMPEDPLLEAVRVGDAARVRELVAGGAHLDGRDHAHEVTALELALTLGRFELAEALLAAGADPAAPSANDQSALSCAAVLDEPHARAWIERLLGAGARPTHASLVAAASTGDPWRVDRQLAALPEHGGARDEGLEGALLAGAVRRGPAALEAACHRARGLPDAYLQWAFEAAAATGQAAAWDAVLALGRPDPVRAVHAGGLGWLRDGEARQLELLRRIATEHGRAAAGQLLHLGLAGKGPDARCDALMELAVECGGDTEAKDVRDLTPLLAAADRHDVEAMRRLAALGADVGAVDSRGRGARSYVERWPESVRLAEARACLDALGVPPGFVPFGLAESRPAETGCGVELLAVGIGGVLALGIVAAVLVLHALGLL